MTYAEALQVGYVDGDLSYTRGYVSRRSDLNQQRVYIAGGRRQGDLFVLLPCWTSTKYCFRQYLIWRGKGEPPKFQLE